MSYKKILCVLIFLLNPIFVSANAVWPSLYLEIRILSVWVIALSLFIEYFFLVLWLELSYKSAVFADIVMNLVSTILGILLIPLSGILWEIFPGIILYKLFKVGTFNTGTWAATFVFAVLINLLIESAILRKFFKIAINRNQLKILLIANSITVGIAFVSLFTHPAKL